MAGTNSASLCVFHMGYGKCASTLLQKRIFPKLNLTARVNPQSSRFEGVGSPSAQRRLLAQVFSCSPEIWIEPWIAKELFEGASERLLISEEALFKRQGITSTSHVTAHIAAMRSIAHDRGFSSFKVLAIHRRQDERIASFYAQMSGEFANAGQKNFEDFASSVCDPLRQRYRFGCRLDYAAQVQQLDEAFGAENVGFIPVELLTLDPAEFLRRIFAFLELPDPEESARTFGGEAGNENVKRVGAREWKIQPLHQHLRPSLAERLRRGAVPRDATITLGAELSTHILETFADANRALERRFGDDLDVLGYYPDNYGSNAG